MLTDNLKARNCNRTRPSHIHGPDLLLSSEAWLQQSHKTNCEGCWRALKCAEGCELGMNMYLLDSNIIARPERQCDVRQLIEVICLHNFED